MSKRTLKREQRVQAQRKEKAAKHALAAVRKAEREVAEAQRLATMDPVERERQERNRQIRRDEREAGDARFVAACARGITIAIDCDFEHLMRDRELASMGQQIMYCYGANRRAPAPATLHLVVPRDGPTHRHLVKLSGFDKWLGSFLDHRALSDLVISKKFVYLTSDAPTELAVLDPDVVYVIGGIVDRNRHKGTTFAKAAALGIDTARLPIGHDRPIALGRSSPVLAINHVVDILLHVQANNNDWSTATLVLPARKTTD